MRDDELNENIGRRLAVRRRELRLSLAQVAERCGISFQQIHKYETGQNAISAPMLVKLAGCLGVRVGYFFEDVRPSLDATPSREASV